MIIPNIFIKEDWYQIAHLMNEQGSGGGKYSVLCIAANYVLFPVRTEEEVFVMPSLNKTNGHVCYHEQ